MTPLLYVPRGPTEPSHEKITQARFRTREIGLRIHRTEHGIGWHLPVESRHQPGEPVFADAVVDRAFI
jgi:hypothetical protein